MPTIAPTDYKASRSGENIRTRREVIFEALDKRSRCLVDVHSPDEFTGMVVAPAGRTETAQRGGHVPGTASIPWAKAANDAGPFKAYAEFVQLHQGQGIRPGKDCIAWCRIGERSSHTWFVLKYLLSYQRVRNYDGRWTEWGNLVDAPIGEERS